MIDEAWVDGDRLWAEYCATLRVAAEAEAEQNWGMPRVRINKLIVRSDELQKAVRSNRAIMPTSAWF